MPTTWKKTQRSERIRIRKEKRERGIKTARRTFAYCVMTTELAIPEWAYEHSIREMSASEDHVWLQAGLARILARMDVESGGFPQITKVEYRRCGQCGRMNLNLLAEHRRKLDESCTDGRKLRCGPECSFRAWENRGEL